jgi:coenzyme F420-0:L-glutamate ligase / coenzyme F420-1:gamma-L-glutamate ligase
MLTLTPIPNFPHVRTGDDVAALLLATLRQAGITLQTGDVVAIAQKVISKAEGRFVNLDDVEPGAEAVELAAATDKDPRLVELILQESDEISRYKKGVLVTRHRLGFTSANAGIDRSNVAQAGGGETVLLLPEDPDKSAAAIRQVLQEAFDVPLGVVITDSHGRPFRQGTVGIAIGVAGIPALWDRRGEPDLYGYHLQHTEVGIADEIAAAASLLMGQAAEGRPIVLLRGLYLTAPPGRATDLIRPKSLDLYR